MPADLLEKLVEVEDAAREASQSKPVVPGAVLKTSEQKPALQQPTETVWQRIFKGHEEFLGWTPD